MTIVVVTRKVISAAAAAAETRHWTSGHNNGRERQHAAAECFTKIYTILLIKLFADDMTNDESVGTSVASQGCPLCCVSTGLLDSE